MNNQENICALGEIINHEDLLKRFLHDKLKLLGQWDIKGEVYNFDATNLVELQI